MTEQSRRKGKVRKDTLPLTGTQIAEMEHLYSGFAVWYCIEQQKKQAREGGGR